MFYTKYIQAIFIFVGFAQYCVASTNENLDEPVGYFEKKYMSATFKRIEELEKEGLLNIKVEIRIRDNFNRAREQVKKLNKDLEEIKSIPNNLDFIISWFEDCTSRISEYYDQKNITQKKYFREICYNPFERKFKEIARQYEQFKHHKIAAEKDIDKNLGEKIGFFEKTRMPTAFSKIQELEKEGILDIKSTIRIRDNFNRARKQIYDLKSLINQNLKKYTMQADFQHCIDEVVQEEIQSFIDYNKLSPCIKSYKEAYRSMLQKED